MKELLYARYRDLIARIAEADHSEIKTHPHHRHSADGQHISSVRHLEDVLQLLSEQIMS